MSISKKHAIEHIFTDISKLAKDTKLEQGERVTKIADKLSICEYLVFTQFSKPKKRKKTSKPDDATTTTNTGTCVSA